MGLLCKKLMDVTPTADYEGLDARCKANRHGIWADELDHRYRSVIVDRKILEDHLNSLTNKRRDQRCSKSVAAVMFNLRWWPSEM